MQMLVNIIKNNPNLPGICSVIIIGLFLFVCMLRSRVAGREGLCSPSWGGCTATYMEDGWGTDGLSSIEPQDPYLNSSMVVPDLPKHAITNENMKKNYLIEANKPYIAMHFDDDELNKALLPPPGFLFVGP